MRFKRDLLKHSTIYGIGEILSRFASILLLPLYTRLLSPADYGLIAILDVTVGLLSILIGSGMVSAVARFHFDTEEHAEQCAVWWSGIAFLAGTATCIAVPLILFRESVANLLFGSGSASQGMFLTLAALTMWCNCICRVPQNYLRIQKWSGLVVGLSMFRLLLNIGLNIAFLVGLRMGVEGVLLGNLLTALVLFLVYVGIVVVRVRPIRVEWVVMRKLLAFGWPLIATALLSMVMHDVDRLILRSTMGLEQVGVYSLAYKVGQAVNMLCLMPFTSVWGVLLYEIARRPDAPQIYARVFEKFVAGLGVLMLGASLFAEPLLHILVAEDFDGAVDLVPIICLAYVFFSMHLHLQVPVLLAKKTVGMVPVFTVAAGSNIALNVLLIPLFGTFGAAWASVGTYFVFSALGWSRYRRYEAYPYRFRHCALVLGGQVATFVVCRAVLSHTELGGYGVSLMACCLWAATLFWAEIREVCSGVGLAKLTFMSGRQSVAK